MRPMQKSSTLKSNTKLSISNISVPSMLNVNVLIAEDKNYYNAETEGSSSSSSSSSGELYTPIKRPYQSASQSLLQIRVPTGTEAEELDRKAKKLDTALTQISRIIPNLYISGEDAAKNLNMLNELQIKAVVNATGAPPIHSKITYLAIDLKDSATQSVSEHFYQVATFIDKFLAQRLGVLVHCQYGVSRSPALVIAYLIMRTNMAMVDAFTLVRQRRPVCSPNAGFQFQLVQLWRERNQDWLRQRFCVSNSSKELIYYIASSTDDSMADDPVVKDVRSSALLKCESKPEKKFRPIAYELGETSIKRHFGEILTDKCYCVLFLPKIVIINLQKKKLPQKLNSWLESIRGYEPLAPTTVEITEPSGELNWVLAVISGRTEVSELAYDQLNEKGQLGSL